MIINSPCIGVCNSRGENKCTGCGRTQSERHNWLNFGNKQRTRIIRRAASEGYFNSEQFERVKEAL